jgi:4-amino-4-deoxy-L-arabinose transferase-like glycosyltransferase
MGTNRNTLRASIARSSSSGASDVDEVTARAERPARSRKSGWAEAFMLLAILVVAGWLRWTHVQDVSLHVDEYITLRAARQILDQGLPLLPTGNFYSHGLLLSYAEAGVMALVGFDPVAARLPVLLVSFLGILLTWWVGRRWFSPAAGLLAAALLAFTPEAVIWGGRARMYAPLQLFVLLAVFFYWRGLSQGGTWRDSSLFALSFLAAQFLHAEAMILLPVFALIAAAASLPELRHDGAGAVVRRWWRTGLIAAWFIAALAVLTELWFRSLGPPMVSWLSEGVYGPSARAYVQVSLDWAGIQKTLEPILVSPVILGMIGCLLAGLVYWLVRRRRNRTALCPPGWRPFLVYLAAILALTLPILLLVADPSWKSPRYLFMLLPILYLVLSACLFAVVRQFRVGRRREWVALGVALVCVAAGFWAAARIAAREEVAGYDHAFDYLASQWQPGDAVMTFVPQAAILHLGEVAYLSVPTDYRGFAEQQDGRWLEGWDTTPMVDSAAAVGNALSAQDRLWFVVDERRFHTRFEPGFTQAVWDGMDLVWRDDQVMVFRTADPPPPADVQPRQALFGDQIALEGFALEAMLEPGSDLPMTLYWSAANFPQGIYSTFVHMVDAGGTRWAQDDGPPQGDLYPTAYWWPGEVHRDRKTLSLPPDLPEGLYRLEAGIYEPATGIHLAAPEGGERVTLDFVRVGEPEDLPSDLVPVDAAYGDQIRLLGYTLAPAGERTWTLMLAWAAERPVDGDYTAFVHLVDGGGEIRSQHDGPPGGSFYPTSFWTAAETVLDRHDLTLPAGAPAGTYRLRVGLYQPETGQRLPAPSGDFVELQEWTIP